MLARVLESLKPSGTESDPESYDVTQRMIREIVATNPIRLSPDQNGWKVAQEMVTSQAPGAPVVTEDDRFVGFISESDLLHALGEGRDLSALTARELMNPEFLAVEETAPISEALRLMEQHGLLVLPVVKGDRVVKSVVRSDVMRAMIGLAEGR